VATKARETTNLIGRDKMEGATVYGAHGEKIGINIGGVKTPRGCKLMADCRS
jgi:hypothetical protein